MARRGPDVGETSQIALVDVATGATRVVAGERSVDVGARWLPDGSLLFVSDADGWFQVVRLTADGHDRIVLTAGEREHGEPGGGVGAAPLPSPGRQPVRPCRGPRRAPGPARRRARPRAPPRNAAAAGHPRRRGPSPRPRAGSRINPWDGVWRSVGWLADGAWVVAIGERETAPQDLWLLPVPGVAPDDARPRQVTDSMPAVLRAALGAGPCPDRGTDRHHGTRRPARRGHPLAPAHGDRQARRPRVPTVVYPARRPDRPVVPRLRAVQAAPRRRRVRRLRRRFPRFDRLRPGIPGRQPDEWGNADVHDLVDAARWAAAQPWSDGRLAIYGGSYGGYMVLCALVDEPAMWQAGVDLYGDSEIAESYRHGDRLGRLDLHKMMGSPDDPARTDVYRRGSPVYRAERIEAPLLILHGRKDKRVVPLMTERMVEALEIEGKRYEVHWYDEEAPRLGEAREPP